MSGFSHPLADIHPEASIGQGKRVWQFCVVLKGVSIGAGSVVLPGITIGAGAVVGAGSLVVADVPAGKVVFGHSEHAVPVDINPKTRWENAGGCSS